MADFRITVDSSDLTVAARDTDKLKLANERLENSLEPLIDKEKQLRSAVDLVRQSVDLGIISHKEAKLAVDRLGNEYGKTSKEMRTMANSMGGLRKNTNRMNAMFQNAGYQIGDFAVQVQSGQNVLVAFSQQGAQLAGLLPGLTGALTGVGLVVGTSLLRAFTEGGTAFKSFSELIEEAVESTNAYADALRGVKEAIDLELGPEILEFSRIKLRQELADSTEEASAALEKLTEGSFFSKALGTTLEDNLRSLQRQAVQIKALGDLGDAPQRLAAINKEIEAVEAALRFISTVEVTNLSNQREVKDLIGDINDILLDHADTLGISVKQTDDLISLNDSLKDLTKLLVEDATMANEARRAGIELTNTAITREEAYNQMLERKAQNEAKILSLKKEQVEEQTRLNALTGASTSGSSGSGGSTRVIPSSNSVGGFSSGFFGSGSSSSSYTSPGGLFQLNVGGGGGFANGGVVNRATSFMMTSGRMGVMGEAGPEAILPLKRGANGQLGVQAGGGSGVVINQSFNFVANGDESVKKIIAEEAPRIAKYTEQQIINSRQRGGQMRRAFN